MDGKLEIVLFISVVSENFRVSKNKLFHERKILNSTHDILHLHLHLFFLLLFFNDQNHRNCFLLQITY
jgi:hypothetical protein